jgi:signal transduction histidine kinase/FixJ family two-component response regulator/HAMP domain-containing protein
MLSIRRQLIRTQTFSWIITAVLGALVIVGIVRQANFATQILGREQRQLALERISGEVLGLSNALRNHAVTGAATDLEAFYNQQTILEKDLTDLKIDATDRVDRKMQTWTREYALPVVEARSTSQAKALRVLSDNLSLETSLFDDVQANLDRARTDVQLELEVQRDQRGRESTGLLWLTAIWMIGALGPSILGWFLVTSRVSDALERLETAANKLAEGDLSVRVNESGPLEVQKLGQSLNNLADQLELSRADLESRNDQLEQYASSLERSAVFERSVAKALTVFTSSRDRAHTLQEVMHLLAVDHGFEVGAIYRYLESDQRFELAVTRGGVRGLQDHFHLDDGLVGQAVLDRRTIILEDAPLLRIQTGLAQASARFTALVPVLYQDRIIGALALAHTQRPDASTIGFLEQLAQQLGITLQNLEQYANLQRLSLELQARQDEIEVKNRDLERADRLKTEFLANMSHELRTPLNAVIGFSQLLEQQYFGELNDKQLEYIHEIEGAGGHLLDLINDILDLSKIEAGRMELELERLELAELLESCARLVRERATRAGLDLTLEVVPGLSVSGDKRKLKQVIVNLLSNAVKFTPTGGRVTLKAHPLRRGADVRDGDIEISVEDTGIGIPLEDQDRLFTPFTQVDGSLARRHEGTGLGLALSKRLTELHGGVIEVRSTPGQGSTFSLRLHATVSAPEFVMPEPILETSRESDLKRETFNPQPEPRLENTDRIDTDRIDTDRIDTDRIDTDRIDTNRIDTNAPLILIIEDDTTQANEIAAHLQAAGFRTARAHDGQHGLERARELQPVAITLDIVMPNMDGWAFLEEHQHDQSLSKIPVIVVSVSADLKGRTHHDLTPTISGTVQKPVTREALMDAIIKIGLPQPRPTATNPARTEVEEVQVVQIPSRDRRKNRRPGP